MPKTHDRRGKPYSAAQIATHAAWGARLRAGREAAAAVRKAAAQALEASDPEAITPEGIKAALEPYVRGDK